MWSRVLQQDEAGTGTEAVQSLPKVILVLLSTSVLSSSSYKLQVLAAVTQGGAAPARAGFLEAEQQCPAGAGPGYTAGELLSSFGNVRRGKPWHT